ncbi:MAG: cytochrome b/b6 domain-containing protein [Pseudomonadota bacterium]
MKKTASSFPVWRWIILPALLFACIVMIQNFGGVPVLADEPAAIVKPEAKKTDAPGDTARPPEKGDSTPGPAAAGETSTTAKGEAPAGAQAGPPGGGGRPSTEEPDKPGATGEPPKTVEPEKQTKPDAAGSETAEKTEKTEKADKADKADKSDEAEKPEEDQESEEASDEKVELDNQSCLDCHNPDILDMSAEDRLENVEVEDKPIPARKKPPYTFGPLKLSIDEEKYNEGVHADSTCIDCHSDVGELPHKQRLKLVDCASCHEEFVEDVKVSAHGEKAKKEVRCIGCHDVHHGKGKDAYAEGFKGKYCLDCHTAYGMDTVKAHRNLYEYRMHAKMGCLICHQGDEPGTHRIPRVKTKVAGCESCHSKYTILAAEKPKPMGFGAYITHAGFINKDVLKNFGYVLGAVRIPALDTILILIVLGTFALPIFHGGLRIVTRRKGPIQLPEEKILLHPLIERLWHWFQALCIVMLIITGILLHWPERFPGWFDWAVNVHNWFGWGAVIAFVVWLLYNLATLRIKHYIPRKGDIPHGMIKQAKFYGYGIFKHEPHPYAPSEDNKFNPLQKIAYLKFQLLLFPILLISGILYMYPETFRGIINAMGGMAVLGVIHLMLAAFFTAFLVAHLYLATTGETVGENFKAIITGYGIKEEHGDHKA